MTSYRTVPAYFSRNIRSYGEVSLEGVLGYNEFSSSSKPRRNFDETVDAPRQRLLQHLTLYIDYTT